MILEQIHTRFHCWSSWLAVWILVLARMDSRHRLHYSQTDIFLVLAIIVSASITRQHHFCKNIGLYTYGCDLLSNISRCQNVHMIWLLSAMSYFSTRSWFKRNLSYVTYCLRKTWITFIPIYTSCFIRHTQFKYLWYIPLLFKLSSITMIFHHSVEYGSMYYLYDIRLFCNINLAHLLRLIKGNGTNVEMFTFPFSLFIATLSPIAVHKTRQLNICP